MANTVVIQQPIAIAELVETGWNTDLLSCCDDVNSCCFGFWCCPCLACDTTRKFGQPYCLPLLDICSPAILSAMTAFFGFPMFAPPAALSVRVAIRYKYRIKGSLCKDIATSCFCMWCSWCQMARELKLRKKSPAVNNVQTSNITVIQNAPTTSQVHMARQENYAMSASQPVFVPAPGYATQPPAYASQPPGYVSQAPGYVPPPPSGFISQPAGPLMINKY